MSENESLARKYRPEKFCDLIGQKHVVVPIQNSLRQNRLSQALLFHGPPGTGKTTIARIIARSLNCENPNDVEPCGKCKSCNNTSMDMLEFDSATNGGIDEIRSIQDQVNTSRLSSRFRVFILDEAHMLTKSASNALLKTLEEPPSNVVFILATTELNKILPTVRSRCQRYGLCPLKVTEMKMRLAEISKLISIEIGPDALDLICRGTKGGMRDALQFLDKVRNAKNKSEITVEDVINVFGTVNFNMLFSFFSHLLNNKAESILLYIDKIIKDGVSIESFWSDFHDLLRDVNIVKRAPGITDIVDYDTESLSRIQQKVSEVSSVSLLESWKIALDTLDWLQRPTIAGRSREVVEEASLRIAGIKWKDSTKNVPLQTAEIKPVVETAIAKVEPKKEEKLVYEGLRVFGGKFVALMRTL